ncbi:sensor histidine kinase [Saccharopolyspora sp. NPDC000359]|uniref:sensor histidine kinase n=1 Tax=Saccharopolyspora sp. NPDC000359 TaxID=3154251 RepID=UPI003332D3B5
MPTTDARNWSGRVRPRWSLARQLFVLQVVVVAVVVLAGTALAWYDARQRTEDAARDEVVAVARTLAAQPDVREALVSANPSAALQPLAERVRADTGVDFITIMSPQGIRHTHPDPARIGQPFLGHIEQAVAGQVFTEIFPGTLGFSVRAVVPVHDDGHRLVGLVSDGITVRSISAELEQQVGVLVLVAAGALLLGGLLTYLVSARLRRHTHGLRPAELSRMYEYHDAILHAVREGLLLVSPTGRVTLCNDGAGLLLGVDPRAVEGQRVSDLGLPESLVDSLGSGRAVRDEVHLTDERVLLVNASQIRSGGRDLGTVVTLRDHTELQALSGELDSMRGFAESLRSQAHESANRLHTVVSLVELGRADEAVAFATAELELAQQLTDRVVGAVGEPVLAAVLLGKSAEAGERGVEVVLTDDTEIDDVDLAHVGSRDLVTILGNLVDNAVEAALERPHPRVSVTVRSTSDGVLVRVADNGPGVDPATAQRLFERGWSTKEAGRGLGLALVGQSVRRHRGSIEVTSDGGAVFTVRLPSGSDVAR